MHELNSQLKDLKLAKVQHENQLIASFVQLLNEKKLKIRNQQRLLASATVDPSRGIVWSSFIFYISLLHFHSQLIS